MYVAAMRKRKNPNPMLYEIPAWVACGCTGRVRAGRLIKHLPPPPPQAPGAQIDRPPARRLEVAVAAEAAQGGAEADVELHRDAVLVLELGVRLRVMTTR